MKETELEKYHRFQTELKSLEMELEQKREQAYTIKGCGFIDTKPDEKREVARLRNQIIWRKNEIQRILTKYF